MSWPNTKADYPDAFPTLTDHQLAMFREAGERKTYLHGDLIFAMGDREPGFHVITSGQVAVVDETGESRRVLAVHSPGEFTGDLANISGRPANVSGIAQGTVEVYEVSGERLKQIISMHPGLSDIILTAFIARGQWLRESPNKHATAHFHETRHPLIQSFEPGEDWVYCYPDDVFFEIMPER